MIYHVHQAGGNVQLLGDDYVAWQDNVLLLKSKYKLPLPRLFLESVLKTANQSIWKMDLDHVLLLVLPEGGQVPQLIRLNELLLLGWGPSPS
jgi:hypothetical protein